MIISSKKEKDAKNGQKPNLTEYKESASKLIKNKSRFGSGKQAE